MPKKLALLSAYQDIEDSQLKACFSINRANQNTNMQDIITKLRECYTFQNIPNNYFLVKLILPKDLSKIKIQNTYNYLITNDTEAATFIYEVKKRTYKITISISELIITTNFTNKSKLPTDSKMITEVNLTILIDIPKRITETA